MWWLVCRLLICLSLSVCLSSVCLSVSDLLTNVVEKNINESKVRCSVSQSSLTSATKVQFSFSVVGVATIILVETCCSHFACVCVCVCVFVYVVPIFLIFIHKVDVLSS